MKTLVIAEAGVNHNGDINLARKMVQSAAAAGADMVKFQTFSTSKSISKIAPKADYQITATGDSETQYEMVRKLELSIDHHRELIEECKRQEIGFFSTAFDADSFDMLLKMGLRQVKVPSGELTNLPLIRHMTQFGLPVFLSTGMANLGEIETAIDVIERAGTNRELITVLQCTTEYPAPMESVNLRAMLTMRDALGVEVGYSDHTSGMEVPVAAVALGAKIIEKHFTLDRGLPGPDHQASLEPREFQAMVAAIRNIEKALGDGVKRPSNCELKNKSIARKSIVAIRAIRTGEAYSEDNIGTKRPGTGISPMRWDEVIGRIATRDYIADELIEL